MTMCDAPYPTIINGIDGSRRCFLTLHILAQPIRSGMLYELVGFTDPFAPIPTHIADYLDRDVAEAWESQLLEGGCWLQTADTFTRHVIV